MPEWPEWLVRAYDVEHQENAAGVRFTILRCKACKRAWSMAPNGLENPTNCMRLIKHAEEHAKGTT
jgi:hypothetical protein